MRCTAKATSVLTNEISCISVFKSGIFLDSTYILKSADDPTLQRGTVLLILLAIVNY